VDTLQASGYRTGKSKAAAGAFLSPWGRYQTGLMASSLPIGDFSRATHMSIKALRHYHRVGLLEPADVDHFTGHRRYTTDQIPTAQVIRRFRELDMPIEQIKGILSAPDVPARNELITAHLSELEEGLARTQSAVAALRDLLGPTPEAPRTSISHRSVAATRAAAITATIDISDAGPWYQGALGELRATIGAQGLSTSGAPGGIYAGELFTDEHGQATVFIPCSGELRAVGRAEPLLVPPAELAIIAHEGPENGIDRAYGALATHVTQHAIAVDGPIREYYLSSWFDTADASAWRTEIGWPIFQTAKSSRT
jgi:DNA-binding transcriptional MerR regulator